MLELRFIPSGRIRIDAQTIAALALLRELTDHQTAYAGRCFPVNKTRGIAAFIGPYV